MSSRAPHLSSKKASAMTTRLSQRPTTKFPKHSKLDLGATSMFVQENSLMQPPS